MQINCKIYAYDNMSSKPQEPTDSGSLWFKFLKSAPSIIGFGRLLFDVVRFIVER